MTKYINAEDVAWPEKFTSPLKSAGAVGSDYSPPPIAVQEMCNKTIDKCRQAVENATGIRKLGVEDIFNLLRTTEWFYKNSPTTHDGLYKTAQAIVKLQEVGDE